MNDEQWEAVLFIVSDEMAHAITEVASCEACSPKGVEVPVRVAA
jgi:hypothetical protein